MVEPREASELPELGDAMADMTLDEVGELTLRDADTDALRTLFMWKSVAAENVKQLDDTPEPPDRFAEASTAELGETPLSAAADREARLRLLEYYVSEAVL